MDRLSLIIVICLVSVLLQTASSNPLSLRGSISLPESDTRYRSVLDTDDLELSTSDLDRDSPSLSNSESIMAALRSLTRDSLSVSSRLNTAINRLSYSKRSGVHRRVDIPGGYKPILRFG